jgi:hypothetical protein
MAFKSVEEFNDNRYHNLFRLINDGEYADVVFLYQSMKDMLVAQAHYIKSAEYSGYVHCCEAGCPACAKNIRVQTKLFIPVYNIAKNAIEFWDRTMKFEPQLERDVFNKFANPSEFVFRVTRHGIPNDINTTYSITAVGKNILGTYQDILAKFNAKMPDYYSNIIREVSVADLSSILQSNDTNTVAMPEYTPIPRAGYQTSIPDTYVGTSEAVTIHTAPDTAPEIANSNVSDDDDLPEPTF